MTAPAGNQIMTNDLAIYPFLATGAFPANAMVAANVVVTETIQTANLVPVAGKAIYLCVKVQTPASQTLYQYSILVYDGLAAQTVAFSYGWANNSEVNVVSQYVQQTGNPVVQVEGPSSLTVYTPNVPPPLPAPVLISTGANP